MNISPQGLLTTANRLVDLTTTLHSNPEPERRGGYLVVGADGLRNFNVVRVGRIQDSEKATKYERLAQEKVHRLWAHWLRNPEVAVSSWQTRDENQRMYGGAVLFSAPHERPCVIGFSGHREGIDQAISMITGSYLQIATSDQVERILAVSQNPDNRTIYQELLAAYQRKD
jgi:hypothetical protein